MPHGDFRRRPVGFSRQVPFVIIVNRWMIPTLLLKGGFGRVQGCFSCFTIETHQDFSALRISTKSTMEKYLERYLQLRTALFFDDGTIAAEQEHQSIDASAGASASPSSVLSLLFKLWGRRSTRLLWTIGEWILAWTLIPAFAIWYLWEYHWLVRKFSNKTPASEELQNPIYCQIPAASIPQTSIQQLESFWKDTWGEFSEMILLANKSGSHLHVREEEMLVRLLRSNLRARQLASLLLVKQTQMVPLLEISLEQEELLSKLRRIWPKVLRFPTREADANAVSSNHDNHHHGRRYKLSLIIPAYKECSNQLAKLLDHTYQTCSRPCDVQVIVVLRARDGEPIQSLSIQKFADYQLVYYSDTGGRGGCMNFGATNAGGAILTFLHADTLLPNEWDVRIQEALLLPQDDDRDNHTNDRSATKTTTLCAFSMGIDMSGYSSLWSNNYPMGLWGADRVLGYIRCSICQLPYGDSVLSLPAHIFNYLGGYPDQPLMEDFELVQLLRRRALLFSKEERVAILNDRIACSPRRWHQRGVPLVIVSNAYCIYRYIKLRHSSEDVFAFYYRQSGTIGKSKTS